MEQAESAWQAARMIRLQDSVEPYRGASRAWLLDTAGLLTVQALHQEAHFSCEAPPQVEAGQPVHWGAWLQVKLLHQKAQGHVEGAEPHESGQASLAKLGVAPVASPPVHERVSAELHSNP